MHPSKVTIICYATLKGLLIIVAASFVSMLFASNIIGLSESNVLYKTIVMMAVLGAFLCSDFL